MSRGGEGALAQCRRIAAAVAHEHGVAPEALTGPSRHQSLVKPRFVAIYLCRTCTDASLPQIGKAFGGRDHTSILYAYRKVLNDNDLRSLAEQYQGAAIRAMHLPEANPGHTDGSWTGDMRVVTGYLAEQRANMGDDGRFIITGAPVRADGRSVTVPAQTVFYRGARPYPLAYGLAVYEMRRVNPDPSPDPLVASLEWRLNLIRAEARVLAEAPADAPVKNLSQQLRAILSHGAQAQQAAAAHRDGWFSPVDAPRRAALLRTIGYYTDAAYEGLGLAAEGGLKNKARRRDAIGFVVDVYEEDQQGPLRANPASMAKDVRKIIRQAEKQGCTIWKGRKHYKVRCPEGSQFSISSTPSTPWAILKIRQDFEKRGIEINPYLSPEDVEGFAYVEERSLNPQSPLPPISAVTEDEAKDQLRDHLGAEPQLVDATPYLKGKAKGLPGHVWIYSYQDPEVAYPSQTWTTLVWLGAAKDQRQAERLAARFEKDMVARSKLHYSLRELRDREIVFAYPGGMVLRPSVGGSA